jgi:membrane protein
VSHCKYLADHIPAAKLIRLPGRDSVIYTEPAEPGLRAIEDFLAGLHGVRQGDRARQNLQSPTAVDFMNSAFIFSVLCVVCLFPVLVIISDATGHDVRKAIIVRMGLNSQAAADVDGLIGNGRGALAALTVIGAAFLVLCAIGIASTLQAWYERVYEVPPTKGWQKPLIFRVLWFATFVLYIYVQTQVGQRTGPAGGHVLDFVVAFIVAMLFWWWTVWVLLLGRMGWRTLFPAALASAICLTGLGVFSALLFSNSVISSEKSYGPIGVMSVLLSFLIGFGVCVHIGAVIGRMWNERQERAEMAV